MLDCNCLICAAGALALFSVASALRAPSRSHCAASAVAAATCCATLAGWSDGLLYSQMPSSASAATIQVRSRIGGRGGGTERAALAGFAAAGGGLAACGAGMGGGIGVTVTGGGLIICTGAGSAFVSATAACRVPQNGQYTTRSGNAWPQAALIQRSFTCSNTFQPW